MCELTAVLGIASSVAGFAADSQKTAEENKTREANRVSAIEDFNAQITNQNHNLSQAQKTTNSEGFDAVLAARDAAGKATAEAASQGAAGISVDAVMNAIAAEAGRNETRIDDKREANVLDFKNNITSASTQQRSRTNANQPISGPSPLGLMINVATAGAKAFNKP